jgi:hypothetical protein
LTGGEPTGFCSRAVQAEWCPVGWGTEPQDASFLVRFPIGSLKILKRPFCPHSVALWPTQPLTEISTKEFPWSKVRPARGADRCAGPVVLNVRLRIEAQYSTPLWVFITCYGKSFLLWEKISSNLLFILRDNQLEAWISSKCLPKLLLSHIKALFLCFKEQ